MNLLPEPSFAEYIPNFFSEKENEYFSKKLLSNIFWKHESIKLFGKDIMQPRLTAFYGDKGIAYTYSNRTMIANLWTKELNAIKQKIENHCNINFNCVLLNLYRNGSDSMGWHRDNEKSLGIEPNIASVSFGASRKFEFRNYNDKKQKISIELQNGSLLLMKQQTQNLWEHQLPKSSKITTPRVNLTFRSIF